MLTRAYSLLTIKGIDEDARVITGLATTPSPDRNDDIMEPRGAKFSLPMPLLWQHDKYQPIGEVIHAVAKDDGIHITARIMTLDEPGTLKTRLDEAWQSLKIGLVKGLSVGFKPIDYGRLESGGLHIRKWVWAELSAVTLPANMHATITSVKSFDAPFLAASGTEGTGEVRASAGVPAAVMRAPRPGVKPMKTKSIQDQIVGWKGELVAKQTRREELQTTAATDGRVKSDEEKTEFEELGDQIKSIAGEIKDLEDMEKVQLAQAKAVVVTDKDQGSQARSSQTVVRITDGLPADLGFAAAVLCKAAAYHEIKRGNFVTALDIARQRYPDQTAVQAYMTKATATGGITTHVDYAASLLAPAQALESAFVEFLRPMTIVGKFGTNGIPSLKRVPFNVKIATQTTGAAASWVGEAKAKPVTKFHTTDTTLLFHKIACIAVISKELARFSAPGAEQLVRDELAKAVIAKMDNDFIDPAVAAVTAVNPASITNGLTPQTSAGPTPANALTDIQNLIAPFLELHYDVKDLVVLMPTTLGLSLSLLQNALGQPSYPGVTMNGGTIAGLPVITSQYLASTSGGGNMVVVVSASNVALADDGRVTVEASDQASIQMDTAPTMDSGAGTGASSVSMFQTNSIAILAEREITWQKLRSTAVTYMDDVNWGSIGSP